jgi:peptide deformylase
MILPIYGYGHPVLRRKAEDIGPDYPGLAELIANLYETMYNAQGVGLAAPQVGLPVRIFVVDAAPMAEGSKEEYLRHFKRVFINPRKVEESGKEWPYEEGCLSIPDIREEVRRPERLRLRYLDEQFQPREEVFEGMAARILQHEYDHLEGVLFVDKISPMRRQVIKGRLQKIISGQIQATYRMRFSSPS